MNLYEIGEDPETGKWKLKLNLHPGQQRIWNSDKRYLLALGGVQSGKALDIDTPIATPSGFVRIGDLKEGDIVFDRDGKQCKVLQVHPYLYGRDCYEIKFDDGESIIADEDHLWITSNAHQRKNAARHIENPNEAWVCRPQCQKGPIESILTTKQIAETLYHKKATLFTRVTYNHQIKIAGELDTPDVELPLEPYTLGYWLGDGTSCNGQITCADPEIIDHIKSEGLEVGPPRGKHTAKTYTISPEKTKGGDWKTKKWTSWHHRLRKSNLIKNKHLPHVYWFASSGQRLAVLQGLMDSDGYCSKEKAHCEFCNTNPRLIGAVCHLLRSLGIKFGIKYKANVKAWYVSFTTRIPVFRLSRKLKRLEESREIKRSDTKSRSIISVQKVPSRPVRCITVDSPSRTYLCGEGMIPTHNTSSGPLWLYREIMNRGSGDYLVVSPTFQLLQLKALPEFRRLFEDELHLGIYKQSPIPMFTFSEEGERRIFGSRQRVKTQIFFRHARDPEGLESMTAKGAWLDEAGMPDFKSASWDAIRSRVALNQGRVLMTTTPYEHNWLKNQIYDPYMQAKEKGQEHPEIFVSQFISLENPAFPEEEYYEERNRLPDWKWRMRYRAEFTKPAGVIFDCFDTLTDTCNPFVIPNDWKRYVGLDFGGVNTAAVFLADDPKTKITYLYREYRAGSKTSRQHAEDIQKGEPRFQTVCGGAPSEDQWRREFDQARLFTVYKPLITDVEVGIDKIYEQFVKRNLIVFRNCYGIIDQITTYSRVLNDRDEPTEEIAHKNEYHLIDALRYIIGYIKTSDGNWIKPDASKLKNFGQSENWTATRKWGK